MPRALVLCALFLGCRPVASPNTAAPSAGPHPPMAAPPSPSPAPPSEAELDQRKNLVNRLYDRQDFETAIAEAEVVLVHVPDDVRMLRIATSAHCILGQADKAREHWARMPEHDQKQISTRCARYGITLP